MQTQTTELLGQARARFTQAEIARHVGMDARTVRRWEKGESPLPPMLEATLRELLQRPAAGHPYVSTPKFRLIDLFAGIGGIRRAFEFGKDNPDGGECVFTSEWDRFAAQSYLDNYGSDEPFIGDIVEYLERWSKGENSGIPDHDLLLAGFPCQPFSIAGVSKKNALGVAHGFKDATQGTLFFNVATIIDEKRPYAFMLENVKNLLSHDQGQTFRVIRHVLEKELDYHIHYRVIDGQHFTPQHRERIIIAGFREEVPFSWDALQLPREGPRLASILHRTDGTEPILEWDGNRFFDHKSRKVQSKYTLTPKLWAYLQAYAAKHRAAGNGFGYGLAYPDSVTRTLSARYYKDGSEILVHQGARKRPRRLTPRECARLMGFPDTFRIPVSDTQAYKQFGNSVVTPMIREVARIMIPFIREGVVREKMDASITADMSA